MRWTGKGAVCAMPPFSVCGAPGTQTFCCPRHPAANPTKAYGNCWFGILRYCVPCPRHTVADPVAKTGLVLAGHGSAVVSVRCPAHTAPLCWQATELLYLKQTQLEAMAGEKAAAQLQLEREVAGMRAEAERARRREAADRASSSYASADYDVVPMDSLGGTYQKLANHQRVGHAIKAGARCFPGSHGCADRLCSPCRLHLCSSVDTVMQRIP